jgi:isopropylmalate/homocitrate/citramalate synthase
MKITKKIITVLLLIVVILTGLYLSGFVKSGMENKKLRKELTAGTKTQEIDLDLSRYTDLPEPVRKYFEYTFNGKKSITINHVFWKEKGIFKLPVSKNYFAIKSAQTSITTEPKYMWEGLYMNKTFKFPILESRDAFSIDKHNMRAKAFGQKTVMSTNYSQEQKKSLYTYLMLRYYGTALDFPWALLPNEYIKWLPKNDKQAYLEITYKDLKGRYLVTFNEKNQIIKMETEDYMLHGNSTKLREVGEKSEYKEMNGFMVPTHMEYSWYEENGKMDSNYIFDIEKIEYN